MNLQIHASESNLENQVYFTVAIPTYNGEDRLPKLLDRLRSQINTEHFSWEVIVVDNNSSDNTAAVVQAYQANWPQAFPLRYYLEPKQGAAFARQRGILEARGELVGCIDDDNLPAPNWVAEAYSFGQAYPKTGAYGGQIHGDFEVEPPKNFKRIQWILAIRESGNQPSLYRVKQFHFPAGAAVVFRKKAWCENVPSRPKLLGRVNGSMMGGEDYEQVRYIYDAGWEVWYNPAMHTYHQIPHWRLERDYLLSLMRDGGLCTCYLKLMGAKNWQKPIIIARVILANSRNLLRHLLKYRWQVKTDTIAACEMAFILSSLVSPFYLPRFSSRTQGNSNLSNNYTKPLAEV